MAAAIVADETAVGQYRGQPLDGVAADVRRAGNMELHT
jgi:hypothetical protein